MAIYLDFENEKYQKGYELFNLSDSNIKANVGKRICFLLKKDYDFNRGYMSVRYGTIHSKKYSRLIINDGNDSIDVRDVLECGIEIITKENV